MASKITLPILGYGIQNKALTLNPQTIINYYPIYESHQDTGIKYIKSLQTTPGTYLATATPNKGEIRDILVTNNIMYLVSGAVLYSASIGFNFIQLGTLSTVTGRCKIITNGLQLLVLDGVYGYTYTLATNAFTTMNSTNTPNFPTPAPTYGTYQAGRAIINIPGTDNFQVSNLNDFTTWQALGFATANNDAQNAAQNIVACYCSPAYLFIFKTFSTEFWQLNNDLNIPYAPVFGLIFDQGCAAPFTICHADNTLIWLSQNDQGQGFLLSIYFYKTKTILDEPMQYHFSQIKTFSNAEAHTYTKEGHMFYEISFPTDGKTYLFDVKTLKCVQITSWTIAGYDSNGNPQYTQGRHLARCHGFFNNQNIVGDYRGGNLLVLDENTYTDYNCGVDNSIYREFTTGILSAKKNLLTIHDIELDMESGVSTVQNAGQSIATNLPTIICNFSIDGGRTFNYQKQLQMGFEGEYRKRVKAFSIGQARDWAVKISHNHPEFSAIHAIICTVSEGTS